MLGVKICGKKKCLNVVFQYFTKNKGGIVNCEKKIGTQNKTDRNYDLRKLYFSQYFQKQG